MVQEKMRKEDPKSAFTKTYLSFCVAEDDSLGNCQRVIEITQSIELPLFSLNSHEELFDTLSL